MATDRSGVVFAMCNKLGLYEQNSESRFGGAYWDIALQKLRQESFFRD